MHEMQPLSRRDASCPNAHETSDGRFKRRCHEQKNVKNGVTCSPSASKATVAWWGFRERRVLEALLNWQPFHYGSMPHSWSFGLSWVRMGLLDLDEFKVRQGWKF